MPYQEHLVVLRRPGEGHDHYNLIESWVPTAPVEKPSATSNALRQLGSRLHLPGINQSENLFVSMQEKVRKAWANSDATRKKLDKAEDIGIVSNAESLFKEIKSPC